MERGGYVYITTNKNHTVLYTGVTSNLYSRIWEHRHKTHPKSFTSRYNVDQLIYHVFLPTIEEAIAFEKLLKGKKRQKKIDLINSINPEWKDLFEDLVDNL